MTISFVASVQKVQTLADGGLRFTFDAPETEVMAAAELMEAKRIGVSFTVKLEAIDEPERQRDNTRIHI